MEERKINETIMVMFAQHLAQEEKSKATMDKYMRDIKAFVAFAEGSEITKETVVSYKKYLQERCYAVRSINSMLASLNHLFLYLEWQDCRVKFIRQQKQTYSSENQELTKEEYWRLVEAAQQKPQLQLVLQTICATGIRVSELQYFTVESVRQGEICVDCKGKSRTILIPGKLIEHLLQYAAEEKIETGVILRGRNGNALNRSWIWAQMKDLCEMAHVLPEKVYPHNLRKLFARTFYHLDKDIAKLADVLGHSSINTTRLYIMTTGAEHRKNIEKMDLVR